MFREKTDFVKCFSNDKRSMSYDTGLKLRNIQSLSRSNFDQFASSDFPSISNTMIFENFQILRVFRIIQNYARSPHRFVHIRDRFWYSNILLPAIGCGIDQLIKHAMYSMSKAAQCIELSFLVTFSFFSGDSICACGENWKKEKGKRKKKKKTTTSERVIKKIGLYYGLIFTSELQGWNIQLLFRVAIDSRFYVLFRLQCTSHHVLNLQVL